jgi:hypothetical protein
MSERRGWIVELRSDRELGSLRLNPFVDTLSGAA